MATMHNTFEPKYFTVIHPLHDVPEQKCSSEDLRHIEMTRTVRISLGVLRAYLVAMTLMLGYHVLSLAGVFRGWR
jgi:hypothetical protein